MKRPLLATALLLVAIVWMKLAVWEEDALTAALSGADPPYTGETVTVIGQVCQINPQDAQFQIKSITLIHQGEAISTTQSQSQTIHFSKKYQFLIRTQEDLSNLKIGCRVVLEGTFMPFSHGTNPGEFDAADYYSSRGIIASVKAAALQEVGESYSFTGQAAFLCRQCLQERIESIFPKKQAGIMCALLLGNKSELDSDTKDLYQRNGILHILSISSLHITILGMSLYRTLRKCRAPIPVAAVAAGGLLLFYGWMTGFTLSAVRAIGMFLLRMLALLSGRTYDLMTALGVLAAGMVLYRPYYLLNAGFLLSFSAVFGVGVIYPVLSPGSRRPFTNERETFLRRLLQKLLQRTRDSALVSLSITLATLPIQLRYYYEVPLLSTLVNLLVLPLVKPLVLAGIVCLVPGLGFLGYLDVGILSYYESLCELLDRLALRTWNPGCPSLWQVFAYYGLLGLWILWLREDRWKRGKAFLDRWRVCRILPALVPALLFGLGGLQGNRVLFLDVGQGNGILIHHATGENYLYDCGSSSRQKVGEYVLVPCLKYYGIHRLDAVFLSHPDSDHMNGVLELLETADTERIRVDQVVLPDIAGERRQEEYEKILTTLEKVSGQNKLRFLSAGEHWRLGEVQYTCLHPEADSKIENANDYSLCLAVAFPNYQLLLMGDTGEEWEKLPGEKFRYADSGSPVVLQVAHHGSKYSTSEDFLREVQPAVALLSAGEDNSYGHPHLDTLERLEEAEADVFCTIDTGAILISERRKGIKLTLFDAK